MFRLSHTSTYTLLSKATNYFSHMLLQRWEAFDGWNDIRWGLVNPSPDMSILGFSNSAANNDLMSKVRTNGDAIIWFSGKHYEQFLLFSQCFRKLLVVDDLDSWPIGCEFGAKLLSGIFSPLTTAEACEKSSQWLSKEICVSTGVRKPGNTCVSLTAMIWP